MSAEIFPNGATEALLEPHFLGGALTDILAAATEGISNEAARALYDEFVGARGGHHRRDPICMRHPPSP